MPVSKIFTLEEANALLPQVESLLEEMVFVREKIRAKTPAVQTVLDRSSGNGGNKEAGEYLLLVQRFNASVELLNDLGVEIKDLDIGLVDFPHLYEGRVVYLCWKRGEPHIEYWHELDAGFAGRKPL